MIPVASGVKTEGNLNGFETHEFSISAKSASFVMRSMADLYSDRELACIREYSTNAFDSNKLKASLDNTEVKPIEVSLPDAYNPNFSVRDRGVGMSKEELTEVYTKFGESTKRGSNDFNGMLGFGSKSAIAYTNIFTVVSVKDGLRTSVTINRDEDEMGGYRVTMNILENEVPTDEESGVVVRIPVHNAREFRQKALDFYRFWMPGEVLCDGREPERAIGDKIDDGLYYYTNSNRYGELVSYVVMGNVPYRISNPKALFPKEMNPISFVAYVPNGSVEFTPSREDLKYSDHTKKTLYGVIDNFVEKTKKKAQEEIDQSSNHFEALQNFEKWRGIIGIAALQDLTFKGDKFENTINNDGEIWYRWNNNLTKYTTQKADSVRVTNMINGHIHIITGLPEGIATGVPGNWKSKFKDWMDEHFNDEPNIVYFTNAEKIKNPWVPSSYVVSWSDVKKTKHKRVTAARVRAAKINKGSFDVWTKYGKVKEQEIDDTLSVIYYVDVNAGKFNGIEPDTFLQIFDMDDKVVIVPRNRMNKFLRDYPQAKPFINLIDIQKATIPDDLVALMSEEEKFKEIYDNYHLSKYGDLIPSKFDDPRIQKFVALAFKVKNSQYEDTQYSKYKKLARAVNKTVEVFEVAYWNKKSHPDWIDEYPLWDFANEDHLYLYCNAVFAARKAGENV